MASPYVGEIRMFAGNFAPQGWMTCDGQLLSIAENDTLFNLIGTTYGGDGQNTFALPNLTARIPLHVGNNGTSNYTLAQNGGVTTVTLNGNQIPVHTHPVVADNNPGTVGNPTNAYYAGSQSNTIYSATTIGRDLRTMMTLPVQGGNQPHDNMQPYLAITFIISLYGIYPSPS